MKIAIVGSREFNDYTYLCKCMDYLNSNGNITESDELLASVVVFVLWSPGLLAGGRRRPGSSASWSAGRCALPDCPSVSSLRHRLNGIDPRRNVPFLVAQTTTTNVVLASAVMSAYDHGSRRIIESVPRQIRQSPKSTMDRSRRLRRLSLPRLCQVALNRLAPRCPPVLRSCVPIAPNSPLGRNP